MTAKILIVEDNVPTLNLINSILAPAGYDVHLADTVDKAIYIARQGGLGCAIVDQYLGDKSAYEFVRLLEKEERNFPMVLITGQQTTDLLVKARDHGFDHILKKPVDPDRLLRMVEYALKSAVKPPEA
jgi:two-component system response regulator HydG